MSSDLSRLLPATLPPGRLVGGEDGPKPLLWISDAPAPAGLWQQLHRAHPQSGLWPLLLVPLGDGADYRPWLSGELFPAPVSDPTLYDPDALLRRWWQQLGGTDEDAPEGQPGPEDAAELRAALAPYGPAWPGTAPAAAVPDGAPGIEALPLAAEHTAFCPDLVFQGTGTLTAYAERLVAAHQWSFWWD